MTNDSNRMRRAFGTLALCATIFGAASSASAGTVDFNFSFSLDNGQSASGEFVTTDEGGGKFLITDIQNGFINGNAMTLLAPGGPGPFNDNLLSSTDPRLDIQGLGFSAEGAQWAVWSQNGSVVDSWCNNSTNHTDHECIFLPLPSDPEGAVTAFDVFPVATPVPEPGTLAVLAVGLLGIGLRRRRS